MIWLSRTVIASGKGFWILLGILTCMKADGRGYLFFFSLLRLKRRPMEHSFGPRYRACFATAVVVDSHGLSEWLGVAGLAGSPKIGWQPTRRGLHSADCCVQLNLQFAWLSKLQGWGLRQLEQTLPNYPFPGEEWRRHWMFGPNRKTTYFIAGKTLFALQFYLKFLRIIEVITWKFFLICYQH